MTDQRSRFKKDAGWVHVPRGTKRRCRWCDGPVKPPRRTFCSAKCVHEHKLRSSGSYLREWVEKRDKGVCRECGLDCDRLLKVLKFLNNETYLSWYEARERRIRDKFWDLYGESEEAQEKLIELNHQRRAAREKFEQRHKTWLALANIRYPWAFRFGTKEYVCHLWEADHIVPVAEGGGECSLDNMRTLCIPCHQTETKKLRGRLASSKQKQKRSD
jgi:5-methylcytosine-specific restriction enzyme A